jgi:hypothetical protein
MSAELELIEILSSTPALSTEDAMNTLMLKLAASPFNAVKNLFLEHPEASLGALGAVAAITRQFFANRPKKDGGLSEEQESSLRALESSAAELKKMKSEHKTPGFFQEFRHAHAKHINDLANIFAKHPVRGALTAAPGGAAAGASLSQAIMWALPKARPK